MPGMRRRRSLGLAIVLAYAVVAGGLADEAAAQTRPEGEMRWALYVTLSPVWFDPGEVSGQITPFWFLYALHDALVKPMPGNLMSPSLAESWTVSPDQRIYEFKLREGLKFHNGDPFTAEDVKFSFHRAKGSKILHDKVREVAVVGPARVRFQLHEPWPDFMTFYGTMVSGAGWIVPKKYVERVGDDGFKKAPVGLGPYKFVSHAPGIELVMEANEGYWRDIDALFKQQAVETDRRKREALLHQIQRLVYERVRYGPIFEYVWPSGVGPRVAEPALLLIDPYPWSAPLEEVRLKKP